MLLVRTYHSRKSPVLLVDASHSRTSRRMSGIRVLVPTDNRFDTVSVRVVSLDPDILRSVPVYKLCSQTDTHHRHLNYSLDFGRGSKNPPRTPILILHLRVPGEPPSGKAIRKSLPTAAKSTGIAMFLTNTAKTQGWVRWSQNKGSLTSC